MWRPIPLRTMTQVLERTSGRRPDAAVATRAASGFWTPGDEPLCFSSQTRRLGHSVIVRSAQSALRIRGADGGDDRSVRIGFVLSGSVETVSRSGVTRTVEPGGTLVVVDRDGYDLRAPRATRSLVVRLAESRLSDRGVRLGVIRRFCGGSAALAAPLREFALAVVDASWNPTPSGALVADRVVEDLVVGMLLDTTGHASDSADLREGLRTRALLHIGAHHRDPELSPRTIAARLGVSLRHLQRAFQGSESSIASAVAHRRAETAALVLSSSGGATITMGELAARAGFHSEYELRAAFRSRYGELPSSFRDRALGHTSGPAAAVDRVAVDRAVGHRLGERRAGDGVSDDAAPTTGRTRSGRA